MDEMKQDMETLCSLYHSLVVAANSEMAHGVEGVDTTEMGQVIDMIKDLAEAKKDCMKACYYKTVIEAMGEDVERRGFREQMKPVYDESYFPDDYTDDEVAKAWRMGYHDKEVPLTTKTNPHTRYGIAYDEYVDAKKHYTTSKSESDKEEMERHIREHLSDTMSSVSEMYKAADPELRKRIKADITKLANDMT